MKRCSALALAAAALVAAACSRGPSAEERAAWQREIETLTADADALQGRLRALVEADPRRAGVPDGDVVIAVPTAFLDAIVQRVFADVASRVDLTLSGIKTHQEKTLRKGRIPIGDVTVDLLVEKVNGRLGPGTPKVVFGGNEVTLSLPVDLVEGSGEADVHVFWKGRNVAGAVCGDLDLRERVSGSVIRASYPLQGTLSFSAQGAEIVATPRFPETKLQLRVAPSPATWAKIEAILASQTGLCKWVLEQVDLKQHLAKQFQEKGFGVKLPLHKIKPFRFPAGLSESVVVRDKTLALDVRAETLRIDDTAVWLGARVAVKPAAPAVPET
jgi:hypothetical protein